MVLPHEFEEGDARPVGVARAIEAPLAVVHARADQGVVSQRTTGICIVRKSKQCRRRAGIISNLSGKAGEGAERVVPKDALLGVES